MSLLHAILAVHPLKIPLPDDEGILTVVIEEALAGNPEKIARTPISEVRFFHGPDCKGEVIVKPISLRFKKVLWCASCHMRLGIPGEEVENLGELVLFFDGVRKKQRVA